MLPIALLVLICAFSGFAFSKIEFAGRKLIFEEKFWDAEQYIKKNMLGFYNESYMPLGTLNYVFEGVNAPREYVRYLDSENTFVDSKGRQCGVSYMTTMDLAIIFACNS